MSSKLNKKSGRLAPILAPLVEGVFVIGLGASSGCAGPATPLGAIWDLRPQWAGTQTSEETEQEDASPDQPNIRFEPAHQWLHSAHDLKIVVRDPGGVGADYDISVRYHGHDVTRSLMLQAHVTHTQEQLVVDVPSIRLSPVAEHLIEVAYRDPDTGRHARSRLRGPVCRAFENHRIRNLDEFRPDPGLMQDIEMISRQMAFNPAFTAALIAQESAFNPESVSVARALGLTQVTASAEEEIAGFFPRWPRYPGLNNVPGPVLKWLVLSGEVNSRNEWRLNPERSIRGGLAFARMLSERWADSDGMSKVGWVSGSRGADSDLEIARTKLILAAYNSGFARVLQAINHHGAAWLSAPELKEARRYVNRIFSLCDAFEHAGQPQSERTQEGEAPASDPPFPPALIQKVMHENET